MSTRTIAPPASAAPWSRSAEPSSAFSGPARSKPLVELWHPWVTRHWPSTATEEALFVTQLEMLAEQQSHAPMFDRRDVTALVTALRCGLTVDELLERARGLKPARLLAAHRYLDGERRRGQEAWQAIVADPTAATLAEHGPLAATVLPVIISHLDAIVRRGGQDLAPSIGAADAEIARTAESVRVLDERLDACVAPSDRGRAIGTLLYDAYGEGAWSLGTFLAPRVGALVPLRVASLLGEDRPGQLRKAS
jgi:hypothetical protein